MRLSCMNIDEINKIEKNQQYILGMRPALNKKALFSDTTQDYVTPAEPNAYEEVTIRFRAEKKNIDRVFFVCGNEKLLMNLESSDESFDYYAIRYHLGNEKISYFFEVNAGRLVGYYDKRGLNREVNEYCNFVIIPGFKTPDWAKGAVIYQIYVDRFCNGDPSNDVETNEYRYINQNVSHVEDWYRYPATMDVRDFYGGDLQGVLDKMDYLKDLGIEVIYFNPLFVSPSNHKYDIQDYDYIDPHIGCIVDDKGDLLRDDQTENRFATKYRNRVTNKANLDASNALFARVVEEAHKRGIRVILDGVFNHCGSFNKWLDRERIYEDTDGYETGAYISKDSIYRQYFLFQQDRWPYNSAYEGWWGHNTLPKLNYEGSKELFEYIMHIAAKWVSAPYHADGWRLDVAADLGLSPKFNHYFWQEFRRVVKEANPDALILAEHYGDIRDWLQGNEWDSVMNYDAFMEPVTWFLTGMEKHSDDFRQDLLGNAESFWECMIHDGASFPTPSQQVAMNQLSNHDHSRFMTRTSHKVGRIATMGSEAANQGNNPAVFREGVVIQMTWPGAPSIYYGDEAGVCGFTDPDNRRTYPWGREDKGLIAFHKDIIRIHKNSPEIKTGSIQCLDMDYNYMAYGRFNHNNQTIVLVNNNDYELEKKVSVWLTGIRKETVIYKVLETNQNGYTTEREEIPVEGGKITIVLKAYSAVILQNR